MAGPEADFAARRCNITACFREAPA